MTEKENRLDLSICIPVFNEEENIPVIIDRIMKVMKSIPEYSYEIVMVDDWSIDKSWQVMLEMKQKCRNLRCLQFEKNSGDSAAAATAGHA